MTSNIQLWQKCKRVLDSCVTMEQLKVAEKYCDLFAKRYRYDLDIDLALKRFLLSLAEKDNDGFIGSLDE